MKNKDKERIKELEESRDNWQGWAIVFGIVLIVFFMFVAFIDNPHKKINELEQQLQSCQEDLVEVPIIAHEEMIFTCYGSDVDERENGFTIQPTKEVDCQGFVKVTPEEYRIGIGWIEGVAEPIRINQSWVDSNCEVIK